MKLTLTLPPQQTMFSSVAIQLRRLSTHDVNGDLPAFTWPLIYDQEQKSESSVVVVAVNFDAELPVSMSNCQQEKG